MRSSLLGNYTGDRNRICRFCFLPHIKRARDSSRRGMTGISREDKKATRHLRFAAGDGAEKRFATSTRFSHI